MEAFFSIVIPTYNRPQQLRGCLHALAGLDYPAERYEVILVDDGGSAPLGPVVAEYVDAVVIQLLRQEHAGIAVGRNTGLAQARGAFLAFIDDDCRPTPTWLRCLAARFQQTPDALIGGKVVNALQDNVFSSASQLLIDYLHDHLNASFGPSSFFAGNNIACPIGPLTALGGFNPSFYTLAAGEDRDLCHRWRSAGWPLLYAPEAVVEHAHSLHFASFFWQHFSYGKGAYCYRRERARRTRDSLRFEPYAFYRDLLLYPGRQQRGRRALVLTAAFALSQVAVSAGFAWQAWQSYGIAD
jgi:glycosyltransferase involved in cell wall biosynthesis